MKHTTIGLWLLGLSLWIARLPSWAARLPLLTILFVTGCAPSADGTADEGTRLHALFEEAWAARLAENPVFATGVGHHQLDDRLAAVTIAEQEQQAGWRRQMLERLEQINPTRLSETDRISLDIFRRQLRERIEEFELAHYRMMLTVDSGFHIELARLPAAMPFSTAADYDNYLARLGDIPRYVEENIGLLRDGLAHGMTLPRVVLEGYEVTIASHVVDDPKASVFYDPFEDFPSTLPEAVRNRLRGAGAAAIRASVVPAYQAFLDFMIDEYIPGARTTLGASELPNGRQYYAQRIRYFTTLDDVSADEIHSIGHREVARIRAEMQQIIDGLEFDGDFAGFLKFLRTDPQFYAQTPEELLREASYLAKRMDAALPALFKTLPRMPYGVAPVPDHLAPKYTGGRYIGAPRGGTQPGYYWVNTYALESRPLYVLPALTLHEAVPGHHLQIALAQELENLPNFRRFTYLSAFGEGWGLYAEWLGIEAGIYDDPYSHFGRLTYEMWRACRLVVDTGLHAKGWTREQAMDFLASNTALSLHEVRTETDRYISWPGQALAYKMGELKIKELRQRAEQALGERFDVREFHDVVLSGGSVPLTVLEQMIDGYIERTKES